MTNWLREALLIPPLKCHFRQNELSENRILFCLRFFINDCFLLSLIPNTRCIYTCFSFFCFQPFLFAVYSSGLSLVSFHLENLSLGRTPLGALWWNQYFPVTFLVLLHQQLLPVNFESTGTSLVFCWPPGVGLSSLYYPFQRIYTYNILLLLDICIFH